MAADQAVLVLEEISHRLEIVALDAAEYMRTIASLAAVGITGGAIYDGLIAQCALKAKAEIIYTWNIRHFRQLGPEIERRLRVPGAGTAP